MAMIQQKSVLFVAPSAYPLGGVAVWLNYLLSGLADQGFTSYLGLLSGQFHQVDRYLAQYKFDKRVTIVPIHSGSGTREGRVNSIAQAIEQTQVDCVLSVNVPDVFEAGNRVKQRINPTLKVVMTLHGLETDYFLDIQVNAAQIDAVVATSRLACRMVEQWAGFSPSRVFYAPCGVELLPMLNNTKAQKSSQQPLVILYAGRFEQKRKRIGDLVDVIKQLEQEQFPYRLLLAGAGAETNTILQSLHRLTQFGQVTYLGSLTVEELRVQGYQQADVLIMLSDRETGPIVIWEAMANGVAVVTSQYCGSIAEGSLKHEHNALLFPVANSRAASQAIQRMSDPALRQRLINNAYQLVQQRYSRAQSVQHWQQAILEIINEVEVKPTTALRQGWKKYGRIERILGHVWGHKMRMLLNKPALQNSAGAEWPHSLSSVSSDVRQHFIKTMQQIERT